MQNLDFYRNTLNLNSETEVFEFILQELKPSNRLWSYFVNWEKVQTKTQEFERILNLLNTLIGKDNFDEEFKDLLYNYPEIIPFIPSLVAIPDNERSFDILVDYSNRKLLYKNYDFNNKNIDEQSLNKYLEFVEQIGLKQLLVSQQIKNLADYFFGIEVGLDTNARKNRGGTSMEKIVEAFIKNLSNLYNFDYFKEKTPTQIKTELGFIVPQDTKVNRFDFGFIYNEDLFIIETNFYSGGGSKLKSTAGEYQSLNERISSSNIHFIWITDGPGWQKHRNDLQDTFEKNDFVFTLKMLEEGILEHLLSQIK